MDVFDESVCHSRTPFLSPPTLNVNGSISESSCSAGSSLPSRTMSNAYSSQRDFESGPWDEKLEEPSHGVVTQRSRNKRSRTSMNVGKKFGKTQEEATCTFRQKHEALWEKIGNTTLQSSMGLRKNISMREAMEFNSPKAVAILDTVADSLVTSKIKLRATPKRTLDTCESHRLGLVEHPSGRGARVLRL